jgi:penicillin-binding protein 2
MDEALAGVATRGTAAWKFQGWPQDKIPLHAKTGTAEVYGKQTTSWLATYSKDYTVIMTISQAGTGSGASGEAVRKIYNSRYGVDAEGKIDKRKALLPTPQKSLPKVQRDGTIKAPKVQKYDPEADEANQETPQGGASETPVATTPSPTAGNRQTRRRPGRRGARGRTA